MANKEKDYIDLDRVSDEDFNEHLLDLTNTYGYELLSAELYSVSKDIGNLQNVKDNDDLQFRKGQLAMIGYLLNLRTLIEEMAKEAEEETVH